MNQNGMLDAKERIEWQNLITNLMTSREASDKGEKNNFQTDQFFRLATDRDGVPIDKDPVACIIRSTSG